MFGLFKKATKPVQGLGAKIRSLLGNKLSTDNIEALEEILYQADLGSEMVDEPIKVCAKKLKSNQAISIDACIDVLKADLKERLLSPPELKLSHKPHITLIVGVNGSGKTTSTAKLANYFKSQKRSVLLAAADTFRAAAIEQLGMWADDLNIPIVKGTPGGDPAACVFDACEAAKARAVDHLLIDTAGRLHTKTDLMGELQKIYKVCKKVEPSAPHETWITLDASIGQNAIEQAKLFAKYAPLTGIILSKWDGSAKGGACLPIQKSLNIPVRFIGVGEKAADLMPFDKETFVEALFS